MGKLSITGKAEREVKCDGVSLSIKFYIQGKTTTEALRNIKKQSEKFLRLITEQGVSLRDIHIGDNTIDRRLTDDEITVRATREMVVRLPFHMGTINCITELIREQNFSVDLDCNYHIINKQQLHTELLKEALADSKRKAEIIAETMGQKIIGIDSADHEGEDELILLIDEQDRLVGECHDMPFSNQLEAPLRRESETINVVWLIE